MSITWGWSPSPPSQVLRLCLNRTNGKDNRVRLRTSSRTIGEDGSKPNLNPNPNPNANPKPKPNTKPNPKKKKLRKET